MVASYGEEFGGETRLDTDLGKAEGGAGGRTHGLVGVLGAQAVAGGEEVGGLQGVAAADGVRQVAQGAAACGAARSTRWKKR